jgi:serine/threonine protein kinase/DNA-directed RNA polymerase subunit RPC12/RpoP
MSDSEKSESSNSGDDASSFLTRAMTTNLPSPSTMVTVLDITKDALPMRFGRFELQQIVGQGGFGTVFRAYDTQLDRHVALKIHRRGILETEDQVARFLREARSGGKLNHPNICPVHDVGHLHGNHYIVMGFIEGVPLSTLFSSVHPMDPKTAANIILKLTIALSEAHDQGIIHRDLKPSNIMMDQKRNEPIILDFGLARSYVVETDQTQTGQVVGTPAYMSPEQARGPTAAVGPLTDVYSLGVILYELITGRPPFRGSLAEIFTQILTAQPPPPAKHRPELDAAISAISLKAMAKEPAQRFASMRDFGQALQAYLRVGAGSLPPRTGRIAGTTALNKSPRSAVPLKASPARSIATADKIEFTCPKCKLPVRTPAATAGKRGKCPNCQAIIPIPNQTAAAVPIEPRRSGSPVQASRSIEFDCSHCGQPVRTPPGTAGKKGRCPHCERIIDIPTGK